MAQKTKLSPTLVTDVLQTFTATISQQRQQGKKVTFTDFGTFLVRKREPAAGSYPKTKPNELKSRPFKPPPCAPENPSKTPSDLRNFAEPAKQAPSQQFQQRTTLSQQA